MRMLIQSEEIQKIIYAMQKGKLMKYIERLRNKLSKQREGYERLKLNDSDTVYQWRTRRSDEHTSELK